MKLGTVYMSYPYKRYLSLFAAHQAPVVGHSYPQLPAFFHTNTPELGQLNHDRVTNGEIPVNLRDG